MALSTFLAYVTDGKFGLKMLAHAQQPLSHEDFAFQRTLQSALQTLTLPANSPETGGGDKLRPGVSTDASHNPKNEAQVGTVAAELVNDILNPSKPAAKKVPVYCGSKALLLCHVLNQSGTPCKVVRYKQVAWEDNSAWGFRDGYHYCVVTNNGTYVDADPMFPTLRNRVFVASPGDQYYELYHRSVENAAREAMEDSENPDTFFGGDCSGIVDVYRDCADEIARFSATVGARK